MPICVTALSQLCHFMFLLCSFLFTSEHNHFITSLTAHYFYLSFIQLYPRYSINSMHHYLQFMDIDFLFFSQIYLRLSYSFIALI